MKYIQCQTGTFVFNGNQIHYDLPLSKVCIHTYEEYHDATPLIPYAVPFTFESDIEAGLFRIYFELDPGYFPFEQLRRQGTSISLQYVISQLILLGKYFAEQSEVYILYEPINFFVGPEGEVKALFRGVNGLFSGASAVSPLDGIKRLILYLLSSVSFGEIRAAGKEVWTKLHPIYANTGKKVIRASSWTELSEIEFGTRNVISVPEGKWIPKGAITQRKFRIQPKWIAITLGILAIATPFLLPSKQAMDYADPAKSETKKRQSTELINGLRHAAVEQYQEAAKEFSHVNFQTLSKEDQKVVLYTYLQTDQSQKALDLDPTFAENIVQYKIKTNNQNDLLSLKSDLPLIRFEQALINRDDQTMLRLYKQVPITTRRGKIIIRALIRKGRSSEVMQFAEDTKQAELISYAKQRLGIS